MLIGTCVALVYSWPNITLSILVDMHYFSSHLIKALAWWVKQSETYCMVDPVEVMKLC